MKLVIIAAAAHSSLAGKVALESGQNTECHEIELKSN